MILTPLLRQAERELEGYHRYYEAQAGRGRDFVQAMEAGVRRIQEAPMQGPAYLHGTRRLVVFRYPFSIVYLADDPRPVVIAFAHQRRKPGYWARRLKHRS